MDEIGQGNLLFLPMHRPSILLLGNGPHADKIILLLGELRFLFVFLILFLKYKGGTSGLGQYMFVLKKEI